MWNELPPVSNSTHMALAILPIAVVFIPHHHALRIRSVQQRLPRRVTQDKRRTLWHSPSLACCVQCASR